MDKNAIICGVILAGGRSTRMGYDKALIEIDGTPQIRKLAETLLGITDHVLVSSNHSSPYNFLGLPVVADIFPGQGPLAGLHAAMLHSPLPLFILLACDMPRIRPSLLRRLVDLCPGHDAVVPRTSSGQAHPLCAVYRRTCLPVVERLLRGSVNRFTTLFEDRALRVRWLAPEEGSFSEDDLCNLNCPNDLSNFKRWSPP